MVVVTIIIIVIIIIIKIIVIIIIKIIIIIIIIKNVYKSLFDKPQKRALPSHRRTSVTNKINFRKTGTYASSIPTRFNSLLQKALLFSPP